MTDIGKITVKELTEYADYCIGKIPVEERAGFPNNGRDTVNEVRRDMRDGAEYPVIDTGLDPEDRSFIIDIYGSGHIQVMVARIWLNTGRIYLIGWSSARLLYNKPPYGIETFEGFKSRIALPVVPKGILKIPSKL